MVGRPSCHFRFDAAKAEFGQIKLVFTQSGPGTDIRLPTVLGLHACAELALFGSVGFHVPPRRMKRWILPLGVFGSAAMKSISRG
jgi:hypothetical protein